MELDIPAGSLKPGGLAEILASLADNSNITSLSIPSNSVGDAGASAIASALAKNRNVRKLWLQANGISSGVRDLVNWVHRGSVLSLRLNLIDDAGATVLAGALQAGAQLSELDLSGNRIGAQGAESLANALLQTKTLRVLNIRNNDIGNAGAVVLARALESNATVQELFLGANTIGPEGCAAIGNALKENSTLRKLELLQSTLGAAGAAAFVAGLRENSTLQHLIIDIDGSNADEVSNISTALRSNTTITHFDVGERTQLPADLSQLISSTLRINRFIAGLGDGEAEIKLTPRNVSSRSSPHVQQSQATTTSAQPTPSASSPPPASLSARFNSSLPVPASGDASALQQWAAQLQSHLFNTLEARDRELRQLRDSQVTQYERIMNDLKEFLRRSEADMLGLREQMYKDIDARIAAAMRDGLSRSGAASADVTVQQLRDEWEERLMQLEARLRADFDGRVSEVAGAVKKVSSNLVAMKEEAAWVEEQALQARVEEEKRTHDAMDDLSAAVSTLQKSVDEFPAQLQATRATMDTAIAERFKALDMRVHAEEQAKLYVSEMRMNNVIERLAALEKSAVKVDGAVPAGSPARKLTEHLRRDNERSLRDIEVRDKQQAAHLEQRVSELMTRLNMLEATVKTEQEASLKSLEAILAASDK